MKILMMRSAHVPGEWVFFPLEKVSYIVPVPHGEAVSLGLLPGKSYQVFLEDNKHVFILSTADDIKHAIEGFGKKR